MPKEVLILRGSGASIAGLLARRPEILREFEKVVVVEEKVSLPPIPTFINYPKEPLEGGAYWSFVPAFRKRFDHVSKKRLLKKGR